MLFQLAVFLLILTALSWWLGQYMAKVFTGEKNFLSVILGPIENLLYKLFGVNKNEEMNWKPYSLHLIIFNLVGIIALFIIQRIQHFLPLNPQAFGPVRWDTALNTAVSFTTNTNWQAYAGEQTMSYLTQMLGLTVQNFLSAGIGIAVAIAFIRGIARKSVKEIGNFWVDLTRSLLYILLPLSIVLSLVFASNGVIQNFNPYIKAKTLEGQIQTIAQGPVASQEAIKEIGTNGGGFFNANSAHPYENPNPFTDYLEILALLLISAALPFTLGKMLGNHKQGWAIFATMMILFLMCFSLAFWSEFQGNPIFAQLGIERGLNLEGKEVRFGVLSSTLFANATTSTSCGAVNTMHDSLTPLTGLILIFNMIVGEVIFGGVGTGLIGMLLYVILTMFLIGLMIGRTPEIFGKKLEPYDMVMAVIAIILPSIIQLVLGAIAVSTSVGLSGLNNAGPHGMSEIIYAFASGTGNNGSAFAGLSANTLFYNLFLSAAMLIGRFATIIPSLAIAGSLVRKNTVPSGAQFPTDKPLFVGVLIFIVIIVGALTFFPILVLGPFLEHLFLLQGVTF
jgi:K+-transporting ATPase ATPase A chain